ncbi:MAG: recombinase family protein [Candidatus Dormiibacterota bacterium]
MKSPKAAAIYARISSDPAGTALGVERQLEDCRQLAADLGWSVGGEYVDNDVSAYSRTRKRPEYTRMLGDLRDGQCDAVLAYHVDRLYRRPIELEQLLEVAAEARVLGIHFVAGQELDLGNGDGLLVVRMLVAAAAHESASKSRRILRKMEQNAAAGLPHGGGPYHRPFGYESDKITVRESEAELIRTLAGRFLAGESTRSLAKWLEQDGAKTVAGGTWTTTTVRNLLTSGRVAGLREHRGRIVGPAVWPPIISVEQRDRICARLTANVRAGRRTPRRYLLSGLLRCGRCGTRLFSSARRAHRRYVCLSGPDHGGCGHLTVVAGPLEALVADACIFRLDSPELADALAGRASKNREAAALSEELATLRARQEELAHLFAAGDIGGAEWRIAGQDLAQRMHHVEAALSRVTRTDALSGIVGDGDRLRAAWQGISLSRQNAVIRAVLDHAVIAPGVSGARALDHHRVGFVWRA